MKSEITYRVVCEKCGVVKTGEPRRWATHEKEQHVAVHVGLDQTYYIVRVEREK